MKRIIILIIIASILIIGVAIVSGTNDKDTFALKKAILKTPDNSKLHLQLGQALMKLGEYRRNLITWKKEGNHKRKIDYR